MSDNTAVGGVEVVPVNLSLLTEQESRGVHAAYRDLVNQIDYPIQIHSVQTDLDLKPYAEYLLERFSRFRDLWEDYIRYWSSFDQENLVATRHFITVQVDGGSEESVRQEADRRVREILETINSGQISAEPVDTGEVARSLSKHFKAGNPDKRYVATQPEYRRSVVVEEFPTELKLAWPLDLLRINGKVDATQIVEPVQEGDIRNRLSSLKQRLNVERDTRLSSGVFNTKQLERALRDTDWMMEELADGTQRPFRHSILFTAHANTQERCDQVFSQLESQLQRLGIQYREPVFETDKALETQRLTGEPRLTEDYLLLSNSVAASLPFATQPFNAEAGVIFGEDEFDKTPILLDRYSWHSPHLARFGAAGSGKSFHAGIEMLRSFLAYPDLQIIVVDLKNDFGGLVKHLGGEIHSVEDRPQELDDVVAFQMPERGRRRYLSEAVDLLEHLYSVTSRNTEQRTLVVVDEAHNFAAPDDTRDTGGVGRGLSLLSRWIREARDTKTAVSVVSQSAADFTDHSEGRKLLDQCPGKVFFQHERVPESMTRYFDLSQQEVYDIQYLTPGDADATDHSEAVLKVSNRIDAKIRVEATPAEQSVIENQTR